MKKKNTLFQHLKQWCLKVSVSSIIFISIVLLGGAIITLALPSSLDEVKSTNAHQQLTAENWDYLVDQVKSGTVNLTNLSGKISTNITNITNLSGRIAINTTNIANLSGRLTTVSSTINSGRKKMGDTIYYTSGNVGIGITTPNDKLHVNGNIIADGGIKVGTTTATCNSSTEGTLKYTENCLFYCNGDEWKEISCPEPINGICGSINETTASSKPTSNLCAAGTASTVNGNGPRTWTCNGSNNGSDANCSVQACVNIEVCTQWQRRFFKDYCGKQYGLKTLAAITGGNYETCGFYGPYVPDWWNNSPDGYYDSSSTCISTKTICVPSSETSKYCTTSSSPTQYYSFNGVFPTGSRCQQNGDCVATCNCLAAGCSSTNIGWW